MKKILISIVVIIILALVSVLSVLVYQGTIKPPTDGEYVALGSSFAAGLGLGSREAGSPFVCMRSTNGYPQQLARMLNISLVDMSCSGATVEQVLKGGQIFLGPQIEAVGPNTRLVTLTAGGNDLSYIGDLVMMSQRRKDGLAVKLTGLVWDGAKAVEDREFAQLQENFIATFNEIHRRSPNAKIVLVKYPRVLPDAGNCLQTGVSDEEAELMLQVAKRFSEVQDAAAKAVNVMLVDMDAISVGHDACSSDPWVHGAAPSEGAPFHPSLAGAKATALQIKLRLEAE